MPASVTCDSVKAAGWQDLTRPRGKRASVSRERLGRDLAGIAGNADELGAAGEELRRAAFVVVDMGFLVAEHGLPGPGERRQRERVGGGAGGDQERRDVALEYLGESR